MVWFNSQGSKFPTSPPPGHVPGKGPQPSGPPPPKKPNQRTITDTLKEKMRTHKKFEVCVEHEGTRYVDVWLYIFAGNIYEAAIKAVRFIESQTDLYGGPVVIDEACVGVRVADGGPGHKLQFKRDGETFWVGKDVQGTTPPEALLELSRDAAAMEALGEGAKVAADSIIGTHWATQSELNALEKEAWEIKCREDGKRLEQLDIDLRNALGLPPPPWWKTWKRDLVFWFKFTFSRRG